MRPSSKAAGVVLALVVWSSVPACRRAPVARGPVAAAKPRVAELDPSRCPALPTGVTAREPLPQPPPLPPAAQQMVEDGVILADGGGYTKALAQLEAAARLVPDHPVIAYETAFVHFKNGEPARAIEILARHTIRFGPLGYQMLGNAYDEAGQPACALRVYLEGMRAFPAFGGTYFDTGIVLDAHGDATGALEAWERGIDRAPLHPTNYVAAAAMLGGTDPIWARLYAEAFLSLEPAGRRSDDVRKLLFDLYLDSATVTRKDDGWKLRVNVAGSGSNQLPVSWLVVNGTAIEAVLKDDVASWSELRLDTLHRIRAMAVHLWTFMGYADRCPHPVLARLVELEAAGLLEPYDYFVFGAAHPEEAAVYARNHEEAVEAFAKWAAAHPFRPEPGTMARDPDASGCTGD